MPPSVKVCEITAFEIVILICFSKKAAPDSKPISNFNNLHQRSFFKSRLQMFFKIVVPKNFANLTGKQYWSLFLVKLQALAL